MLIRICDIDMYQKEIGSSPLLYSGLPDNDALWAELVEYNGLQLANYSGDFQQILDIKPHWAAVDTLNTFKLDALNESIFNWSLPQGLPDPFPFRHTRLRFNDTLIHTPPILLNEISNALLRYWQISAPFIS